MPRSPSESCEVVRATGRIIEISDETLPELQTTMGLKEEMTKVSSAIADDRLDMSNDAAITTYNTMWFTDDPSEPRTDPDDECVQLSDATEVSGAAREDCDNTLYVMLQTDEPCEAGERRMKVYLRLSLNGIKQYDIPAKQIEGLDDTFIVATRVPSGKNVALVQLVKTWHSGYSALEVAPNSHIVDIDRDTLLHVKWRKEMHKIIMAPRQQVIFVLEGPSEPVTTSGSNMRSMECWQDDKLSQYVMQFPSTGTLVAVPVQPMEDSQESQLVHRVLSRESESEWDSVIDHTNTVHLSSLAHSSILVSRWNDPAVYTTEVELTTRGYLVDQTDPNILQVLKGTTEMYLVRNEVNQDSEADLTHLHTPTASSGDLFPPSEDSDPEMNDDGEPRATDKDVSDAKDAVGIENSQPCADRSTDASNDSETVMTEDGVASVAECTASRSDSNNDASDAIKTTLIEDAEPCPSVNNDDAITKDDVPCAKPDTNMLAFSDDMLIENSLLGANKYSNDSLSPIPMDDLAVGANVSIVGSKEEFILTTCSQEIMHTSPKEVLPLPLENIAGAALVNDNMSATVDETPDDAIPCADETTTIIDDTLPAPEDATPDATSPTNVTIVVEQVATNGFNETDSMPPMLCDEDQSASVTVHSDTMLLGGPELDNNMAASLSNESMPSVPNIKSVSAVASANMNLATLSATDINDPTKAPGSRDRIPISEKIEPERDAKPDATKPTAADPILEETANGLIFGLNCDYPTIADAKTPAAKPSKSKRVKSLFCACGGNKHEDDN